MNQNQSLSEKYERIPQAQLGRMSTGRGNYKLSFEGRYYLKEKNGDHLKKENAKINRWYADDRSSVVELCSGEGEPTGEFYFKKSRRPQPINPQRGQQTQSSPPPPPPLFRRERSYEDGAQNQMNEFEDDLYGENFRSQQQRRQQQQQQPMRMNFLPNVNVPPPTPRPRVSSIIPNSVKPGDLVFVTLEGLWTSTDFSVFLNHQSANLQPERVAVLQTTYDGQRRNLTVTLRIGADSRMNGPCNLRFSCQSCWCVAQIEIEGRNDIPVRFPEQESRITSLKPNIGPVQGGNCVDMFFAITRTDYFIRYVNRSNQENVAFGFRAGKIEKIDTDVLNFNDQDIGDANFHAIVRVPPAEYPGKVDVGLSFGGYQNLLRIDITEGYEYKPQEKRDEQIIIGNLVVDEESDESNMFHDNNGLDGFDDDGFDGSDISATSEEHETDLFGGNPLFYAIGMNDMRLVKYYVQVKNYDLNHRDICGFSAFDVANELGRAEILEFLNDIVESRNSTTEETKMSSSEDKVEIVPKSIVKPKKRRKRKKVKMKILVTEKERQWSFLLSIIGIFACIVLFYSVVVLSLPLITTSNVTKSGGKILTRVMSHEKYQNDVSDLHSPRPEIERFEVITSEDSHDSGEKARNLQFMDWDRNSFHWSNDGFNVYIAFLVMNENGDVYWVVPKRHFQVCSMDYTNIQRLEKYTVYEYTGKECRFYGDQFDASWCADIIEVTFSEKVYILKISETEDPAVAGNGCGTNNKMIWDYDLYFKNTDCFPDVSMIKLKSSRIENDQFIIDFGYIPYPDQEDIDNDGKLVFDAGLGVKDIQLLPVMTSITASGVFDPSTNAFPNLRYTVSDMKDGLMRVEYRANVNDLRTDSGVTKTHVYDPSTLELKYIEYSYPLSVQGMYKSHVPGLEWDIGHGICQVVAKFGIVDNENLSASFIYTEDGLHWEDLYTPYLKKHFVYDCTDGLTLKIERLDGCNIFEPKNVWKKTLVVETENYETNEGVRTSFFKPINPSAEFADKDFSGNLWEQICPVIPDGSPTGKIYKIGFNSPFTFRIEIDPVHQPFNQVPYRFSAWVESGQNDRNPLALGTQEPIFLKIEKVAGSDDLKLDSNVFSFLIRLVKYDNDGGGYDEYEFNENDSELSIESKTADMRKHTKCDDNEFCNVCFGTRLTRCENPKCYGSHDINFCECQCVECVDNNCEECNGN